MNEKGLCWKQIDIFRDGVQSMVEKKMHGFIVQVKDTA
jgi:hypothetical protein